MLVLLLLTIGVVQEKTPAQEKTVDQWIVDLSAKDAAVRRAASRRLGNYRRHAPKVVPALAKALTDADPAVRAGAATSLGKFGAAAAPAVERLIQLTTDRTDFGRGERVWGVACQALGAIGKPAVEPLHNALSSKNPDQVVGAAVSLHFVGPAGKPAAAKLIQLIESDNEDIRKAAIIAFQGIGDAAPEAIPALTKMLRHQDFHTQYQACRALGKMGAKAKTAVPVLIGLTKEGPPSVRSNAALALGQIGPVIGQDGLAHIMALLDDFSQVTKERAVIALGELGPFAKSAVPKIRQMLKDRKIAARSQAAMVLWRITGEKQPSLTILLEEVRSVNAPWEAAEALVRLRPRPENAVAGLIQGLKSTEPVVRYSCVTVLGEFGAGAKEAVEDLKRLLKDEDAEVRQAAAEALKKIQ